MKWHGRIPSQEAQGHKKEKKHGLGKMEKAFTQAIPSPGKEWKAWNTSPKAHMSFMPQELKTPTKMYNRIRQTRRQQKWREGQKGMDSDGSGAYTKGLSTTYLYPANTWEVGHESRVSEGVVWQWWERRGLFWGSHSNFFGRNVLLGWHLTQKK